MFSLGWLVAGPEFQLIIQVPSLCHHLLLLDWEYDLIGERYYDINSIG